MRFPAVAGAFYEGTREALLRQIRGCYEHPLGPGTLPEIGRAEKRLVGLVVPHAGYMYSGPVAAHAYRAHAVDGLRPSYIVIGPNHYGQGAPIATTHHDFQTPLGVVKIDPDLRAALLKPPVEEDVLAHRDEHSIEVQLPFLQHLSASARFVPVCMAFQEYEIAAEVGEITARAAEGRDVLLIASSDFSHVGPRYGQVPPGGASAPAFAKDQDAKAIERILALDPEGFARRVADEGISMCGHGPVTALLTAVRKLGGREAKLLKYGTSSDVSEDAHTAVGYGAIAIYR